MKTVRHLFSSQRGVTLIELLVVVVILGIIAAVVIPMVTSNQETSYINTNAQNIQIVNEAVQRYAIEHGGKYPTNNNGVKDRHIDMNKLVLISPEGKGPYLQEMPRIMVANTGDSVSHSNNGSGLHWRVNSLGKVELNAGTASYTIVGAKVTAN